MQVTYLKQALELAEIRRGFCAPNPAVGAVVVKDNLILSTGYHWASGHPHAEAGALNKIGAEANGATIYVTLEPCCHRHKKTPPCTELLIARGIKQVVYGYRDPNPQVAGQGEKALQSAGIECIYLPMDEIHAFYQSYHYWWQNQKPFITAKIALTLDGKIAGPQGERITITGSEAQLFTHLQRKRSDAILTTVSTIIADDPLLNVRLDNKIVKKPLYILDSQLNIPLTAKVFNSTESLVIFHSENSDPEKKLALEKLGAECRTIMQTNTGLNLPDIIHYIGQQGMHDLWIEAGGKCFSTFIQQKLLQRAFIYVAPKWLGNDVQSAFIEPFDFPSTTCSLEWKPLGQDAVCKIDF